jgi:hypothetical protein
LLFKFKSYVKKQLFNFNFDSIISFAA